MGWEAKVKKSDLVFSEKLGLLKAIKSDTVAPSMFLLWESLAGLSNFSNGKVNGLLQKTKEESLCNSQSSTSVNIRMLKSRCR